MEVGREGITRELSSSSTGPSGSEFNTLRLNSTKEGLRLKDKLLDGSDVKVTLIDKKANGSVK